jgi:hypothetical protein
MSESSADECINNFDFAMARRCRINLQTLYRHCTSFEVRALEHLSEASCGSNWAGLVE